MTFTVQLLAKEGDFRALELIYDQPLGDHEFAEGFSSRMLWLRLADESKSQFRSRAQEQARALNEETLIFFTSSNDDDDERNEANG